MARTVNEQGYAQKRNEILDAAIQLVFAKGYERMTIQDIIAALRISSGAFYHYFDSKPALLEAFIQRIKEESEKALLPILRDDSLSALQKLQGFFDTFDRLRMARRREVLDLARVWYTDGNALVRQKVDEAIVRQRAPLITGIARQGLKEGVFTTTHLDQAGEVVLSLLQGMGNTHARLLLSLGKENDDHRIIEEITTTHAAYMEAIELVLGAPPNSLYRIDAEAVRVWVDGPEEK